MTVAVPVRDRREQMLRCLDALLELDYEGYEVLILDNESTDGTGAACLERAGASEVPVRVVVEPGSVGRLRNRAARLATGDVVAFTDSDCMPTRGWLSEAVPPFQEDERLGLVQGPTLPDPTAPGRPWCVSQDLPAWTGRYECCNLIVRREALLGSAGFDEQVFFGEDTAGGAAMVRDGWRTRFAPGALVHHDVTYPGYPWWLRRGLMYGNFARIVRLYPELREQLLWHRVFLRPRSAKLLLALAGVAASRRRPWALLGALPYLAERAPRRRNPVALLFRLGQTFLFDLAVEVGLIRGSIRHRSLLL